MELAASGIERAPRQRAPPGPLYIKPMPFRSRAKLSSAW